MNIKIRIGNWRFTFTLHQVTDVTGVNSLLPNGSHILMWDFDDVPLAVLAWELRRISEEYQLPNIYVLSTGRHKHYIAYCFQKCTWKHAVEIIAATYYVCSDYFKWGVFRKRFTLRVSSKEGRAPKLIKTIHSSAPETAHISELTSWVKDEKEGRTLSSLPLRLIRSYSSAQWKHPPTIRGTR